MIPDTVSDLQFRKVQDGSDEPLVITHLMNFSYLWCVINDQLKILLTCEYRDRCLKEQGQL